MVDAYSDLPFMDAAIHIAIHDKIHAARLVNVQDADVMLSVIRPAVYPFIADKAEDTRQLIGCLIVAPKLAALHKTDNISLFIGGELHVLPPDAKLDIRFVYL